MKKFTVLSLLFLFYFVSFRSDAQTAANGKVLITGTRFTYPIVEKWISEFKKTYPEVEARILPRRTASADSANLIINAHELKQDEIKPGYELINIGRYALLPISNSNNPNNDAWLKHGLKEKEIKELFFEDANYFEEGSKKKEKKEFVPTVYTREEKACAPTAFANHYGLAQENIKGKGVSGDDKFLIYALKKDSSAITYNVPVYTYDHTSRQPNEGLTVIPYDLNENGKVDDDENFYSNLDNLISHVESNKSKSIPVQHVNISYPGKFNNANNNLKLFLDFILSQGQKYNHQFGFLNLDTDFLEKQKAQLFDAK